MTSQPYEQRPSSIPTLPSGRQQEIAGGHGSRTVEELLLRRQVSELERRLDTLGVSERRVRDDLLAALGDRQRSTKEQARLHEELASNARALSELVISEAALQAELVNLRLRLKQLDEESSAARQRAREIIEAALAARSNAQLAERKIRDERWRAWLDAPRPSLRGPKRRGRPSRLIDKVLSRLGPLGNAVALGRSGLWNSAFQADNRTSRRATTVLDYARKRGEADTPVKALFDQRHYLEINPSVAASGQPPLLHYLIHGDRENRTPHPLVDIVYYRAKNPHEIGSTSLTVLQHFLFIGAAKGLNPHPLFDVRFYVSQLSDPHDRLVNPLVHYLRTGWRRGLNPHPLFDNDRYLTRYPEVADMMIAPLLHYVTQGVKEGRDPHPLFFGQWYQTIYPDVQESGQIPLAHFIDTSLAEKRNPNPMFDSGYYLHAAPDAYSSGLDPLSHYIQVGAARGISPSRDFDSVAYLAANPKVLSGRITPLEAFINATRPANSSSE